MLQPKTLPKIEALDLIINWKNSLYLIDDRIKNRKEVGFTENFGKYIAHGKKKNFTVLLTLFWKHCVLTHFPADAPPTAFRRSSGMFF